jgi:hypothetical protein
VVRIAAAVTFTPDNWYQLQTVTLKADVDFSVPLVRQGAKTYPASTHRLSKLQGPVAFEGGVTGADRTLKNGVKLPGEVDGPLFAIGAQAAREPADRRAQHLQRRQPSKTVAAR